MSSVPPLLILVIAALAVIVALVMRRRTLAKMALRNITRKRTYSAIVVAGLLIATAMISGALVVGDTMDYLIKENTFKSTGEVDEVVTVTNDAGESVYFDQSVAYDLIESVEAGDLAHVDGVQPAIREEVTVIKPGEFTASPTSLLFGIDPANIVDPLLDPEGDPVDATDIRDGAVVVNSEMAERLNASAGDFVQIIMGNGTPVTAEISYVAQDSGLSDFQNRRIIFIDMAYLQTSVLNESGMINRLDVSNEGGVEDGYLVTGQAVDELKQFLDAANRFEISTVKEDGVKQAEATSDMISQIFILMSSFAIIAGVALIVNIFVMLAEERKHEMGISRAIGMQRGDLAQGFVFEGAVYSLIASVIGAFTGLLIAGIMIILFSRMLGTSDLTFSLRFEWGSLLTAACAGFLVTALTVTVASWRVSKLNIVRAIRDIPEPMLARSERKYLLLSAALAALGVFMTIGALSTKQAATMTIGPGLLSVGMAMLATRYVRPRLPFTIVGTFLIFWEIDPTSFKVNVLGEKSAGLEMFVISGVVLVIGAVLIAIFNSDLILEGLAKSLGRGKSSLPVFRAAISYPLNKRFRTGLSLFIFSLIMFTVVVIAMLASFQRESVDTMAEKFAGGFDIMGFSVRDVSDTNISQSWSRLNSTLGAGVIFEIRPAVTAPVSLIVNATDGPKDSQLVGFDESILSSGGFSLSDRDGSYATDQEAWAAAVEDPDLVIMDGSVKRNLYGPSFGTFFLSVGDEITLVLANGNETRVTVIGIMDQYIVQGAFTSSQNLKEAVAVWHQNAFYFKTNPTSSLSNDDISKAIEKEFMLHGMVTIVIKDTIQEVMSSVTSTMQLMEVFLGVGLVVGIAGLGIITIRNVAERRQEIGVMRAIGFQRGMILKVFLIETSFVSLLGIIAGVALGLLLSWRLYDWGGFSENGPFVVPWGEVIFLTIIAFVITLASTLPPSRSAARLAPAQALRRVD